MGSVTEREGSIVRANGKDLRLELKPVYNKNISFWYKNIEEWLTSSKAKQGVQVFDPKAWWGIGVEIDIGKILRKKN